ncbi:MAG: ribonuclease HI family protein [Candidatus Moranbacteria bacterium]|nr:ribonuclease HI family protein [Candidatus Moranbacteria bacterium]
MNIIIHTDGGSIGNPGPSAIGAVIEYAGKKKTYAEDIGEGTNNEAEYEALAFALKKTKALLGGKNAKKAKVKCYADSQLMVNQLNHNFKLNDKKIIPLFVKVWNLMMEYKSVEFAYLPRENNQEADGLVKSVINGGKQDKFF